MSDAKLTHRINKDDTVSFTYKGRVIYRAINAAGAAWFANQWNAWSAQDRDHFVGAVG